MSRTRVTAAAVALAAALAAGCDDVPFAPRWDADWNVPLPADTVYLSQHFPPVPIPSGTSANVSFPAQPQPMDESIGQVLERPIRTAGVIVTLSKSAALQFAADDTVFIAASQADLTNALANRIEIPLAIGAAATSVTDTVAITQTEIGMLQTAADTQTDLWIQLRGRATYTGAAPYTVQPGDAIAVQVRLLLRLGISTRVTR